MAGGKRGISRTSARTSPPPIMPMKTGGTMKVPGKDELLPTQPVPLPHIPHDSQTIFEVLVFMYTVVAMGLQYINLYRSVWWLQHSYNHTAVSFYLIDTTVIWFSVLLLGRRLIWLGLKTVFINFFPVSPSGRFLTFSKYCFCALLVFVLVYVSYFIAVNHSIVRILYLLYPCTVYTILFGISPSPLIDLLPGTHGRVRIFKDKMGIYRTNLAVAGGVVNSPELVRMEVNITKTDFNARLKQALFNSLLNCYYAGAVPVLLAQSFVHLETWWLVQHTVIVFVGSLTLYLVQVFPAGYHNLLHRTSLNLGVWTRVSAGGGGNRQVSAPASFYTSWSAASMWPIGAIVRHGKDVYKSEGGMNAAEPGNSHHVRYYYLFADPSVGTAVVLSIQAILVLAQIYIIVRSHVWYHLMSQAILLFIHFYTLFKLGRDYLVLAKVYQAELVLQARVQQQQQSTANASTASSHNIQQQY
eukprot:TRINITY_DN5129_c0_g2_i1.p1 TRINITY_DN5129_c0_g2~~TRINITY_DN5129_c0_g2_i1.p1  ORF type:complete len:470 (-),score=46.90 TRINITY_DN5129_c0_g2_i1:143-1552(-)